MSCETATSCGEYGVGPYLDPRKSPRNLRRFILAFHQSFKELAKRLGADVIEGFTGANLRGRLQFSNESANLNVKAGIACTSPLSRSN